MLAEGAELGLDRARRLITERVPAVARVCQRMTSVPPGCGGPIWFYAPYFYIHRPICGDLP